MTTLLAFGDSLTWGSDPKGGGRYALADRWPTVLAGGLPGVEVVAEGQRGRLTGFDQTAASSDVNGARILPVLLHSHAPIDLVIVMLGTNDIYYGQTPERVGDGYGRIAEVIRGHAYRLTEPCVPDILFIAPPPMVACPDLRVSGEMIARSQELSEIIATVARQVGAGFFDAGSVAQSSPEDGTHMDAGATRAVGLALRPVVGAMLESRNSRDTGR
ncbi:MAG: GDSL-type esterase/lipase family protein [Albidovulum sp.]